ncbi:MAG: DUF4012 domain-containing protein [Planctomycetota bacterium]
MRKHVTTKRVGWALVLLGIIALLVWGVRLGMTALSLRGHLVEVESWTEAPQAVDPVMACETVKAVREDVVQLERRAGLLVRLAPALGWLPRVGGNLRAAPHLLDVGDGLTEAGAIGCDVVGPMLGSFGGGSSGETSSGGISPMDLIEVLEARRSDLQRAEAAMDRAETAWGRVDVEDLSPRISEKAPLLDRGLPLLRSGLSTATVAPDLLGANGPRTYLVLALNEDELRPGGGFISGVGEVHVEAGKLITMTFRDSYDVDDFSQPYPDPPEPMRRYMGLDLWVFRDSNWSPDFPTAAQQAIDLYRPGHPVSIDGVVALDQRAVQELIGALDPVAVQGAAEAITRETILAYMREAWAPGSEDWGREWWQERKSFMGAIAQAAWQSVENGRVDWAILTRSLLRTLEEKHLLVYLAEPTMREVLAEQGWDGGLRPGDGDFLMVVDANLGYNKASAKVQQEALYEVDLSESPPRARLTLTNTHTSAADVACRQEARYAATYEGMMDRCYWDYVQILVPEQARIVDATRIPVAGEMLWNGEDYPGDVMVRGAEGAPCLSWGVMSVLAPGDVETRQFTWTLPPDLVAWEGRQGRYSLKVQKQPGKRSHPLTVRVRLPEGATLARATPEPASAADGWVIYRAELDRDLTFDLDLGRAR